MNYRQCITRTLRIFGLHNIDVERVAQDRVKWKCMLAEGRQRCMTEWFSQKQQSHQARVAKRTVESTEQRLAHQRGGDDDVQLTKKSKVTISEMVGAATQFDAVDRVIRVGSQIATKRGRRERRNTQIVQQRKESRTARIVSRLLHPDVFADWLDGFAGMKSRGPKRMFVVPTMTERDELMSMF